MTLCQNILLSNRKWRKTRMLERMLCFDSGFAENGSEKTISYARHVCQANSLMIIYSMELPSKIKPLTTKRKFLHRKT